MIIRAIIILLLFYNKNSDCLKYKSVMLNDYDNNPIHAFLFKESDDIVEERCQFYTNTEIIYKEIWDYVCADGQSCSTATHQVSLSESGSVYLKVSSAGKIKAYRLNQDYYLMNQQSQLNIEQNEIKFLIPYYLQKNTPVHPLFMNQVFFKNATLKNPQSAIDGMQVVIPKKVDLDSVFEFTLNKFLPVYQFHTKTNYLVSSVAHKVIGHIELIRPNHEFINYHPYKSDLCYYEYKYREAERYESQCSKQKCINLCETLKLDIKSHHHIYTYFKVRNLRFLRSNEMIKNTFNHGVNHLSHRIKNLGKRQFMSTSTWSLACNKIKLTPFDYSGEDVHYVGNAVSLCKTISNQQITDGYFVVTHTDNSGTRTEILTKYETTLYDLNYEIILGANQVHVIKFYSSANAKTSDGLLVAYSNHETMSRILISKHQTTNFVPAICDEYGSPCFSRWDGSFNILGLEDNQEYFIKLESLNSKADYVFEDQIILSKNFLPFLGFRSDNGRSKIRVISASIQLASGHDTENLTCLIVMREIIDRDTIKYYKICGDDIFCILPCNNLVHTNLERENYMVYSILIPNMMQDFLDWQNIHYDVQEELKEYGLTASSITFNSDNFEEKNTPIGDVMKQALNKYHEQIFYKKFPYATYDESSHRSKLEKYTFSGRKQWSGTSYVKAYQKSKGFIPISIPIDPKMNFVEEIPIERYPVFPVPPPPLSPVIEIDIGAIDKENEMKPVNIQPDPIEENGNKKNPVIPIPPVTEKPKVENNKTNKDAGNEKKPENTDSSKNISEQIMIISFSAACSVVLLISVTVSVYYCRRRHWGFEYDT